jgi:CheY-like chemotaxis protein
MDINGMDLLFPEQRRTSWDGRAAMSPSGPGAIARLGPPGVPRVGTSGSHQIVVDSIPQVLLVDSYAPLRDATRMLLNTYGYRVATAASLSEAVLQAHKHACLGVVIVDYELDAFSTGFDVIDAVRAVQAVSPKAIVLTDDLAVAMPPHGPGDETLLVRRPTHGSGLVALIAQVTKEPTKEQAREACGR